MQSPKKEMTKGAGSAEGPSSCGGAGGSSDSGETSVSAEVSGRVAVPPEGTAASKGRKCQKSVPARKPAAKIRTNSRIGGRFRGSSRFPRMGTSLPFRPVSRAVTERTDRCVFSSPLPPGTAGFRSLPRLFCIITRFSPDGKMVIKKTNIPCYPQLLSKWG